MKTINEKNSVKNNQVINDFGQKIGGAHKDRAREAAERLAGVDASALMLQPLSKVAKLPDLRALYLAGAISSDVARLAWYYWSLIGTKPGSSYPSRIRRWADQAAALIGEVSRILSYGLAEKSQISGFLEVERPTQTWNLFNAEMTVANWPENEYKRGAYFVGHYWMNPARYSIHTEKASYYTAFDTVADAVAAIRAKVDKNTTKAPQKFSMYQTSAGVYYITPKGKAGIKLAEFTNKADAWAAYGDTEKLGKIYDELRKFPSERRDWNRPRMGEDWRQGRDMSPESFAEVFPFRGVEFGNWVNQTERAACLNEAADALQDLAAIIGIRPEAVALGGSLAWAFGSRGVGKALAHYEPARRVVNLTKKKGNGCVAHEWFHALDNYMMIQAGRPSLMAVSDCHAYGDCEKSPIFAAAYELKNALLKSDMYTRSRRIDAFRSTPYWATVTEMAARAFEAVIYYKLEAAGMCNDYLVNFKPSDEWNRSECYPYPTKEEAAQLAPLFDAFILAAFTEDERAPMVEPSAGLLPEPPAVVTYDPAQPIESAPFHVQDEAPAVAASEPMNAEEDEAPTPSDGVQGAAYGDAEKSQNPETYGEELADLVALHAMSKQKHPDALVLFRMGDWYQSYFADAQTVADTTGVIIRKHHGAPVAGFPFHALDSYLPRLIRAGHRVVLVDAPAPKVQESAPTEDPAPTDGATGAAYGDSQKSQNSENLPTSLQEWEKSALRDEVEQIAREMGFTPSRYCPSTLFFLRDKNGEAVRNSKGEALTVSISPSYPMGLNDMPGMWYRKGYIDRVLSSYWSVDVEASCKEYSAMKYNPTEKPDPERRRMVIDFDWMLEATAENFRRIMEEILRRFYGDSQKSQNSGRSPETIAMNARLKIDRIDKWFLDEDGELYYQSGMGFYVDGLGWMSMPGDSGLPYNPIGGTKALQSILDDGGLLNYDNVKWVNPVPRKSREFEELREDLLAKIEAGTMTLRNAAAYFCFHGFTGYVDESRAKRFLYENVVPMG